MKLLNLGCGGARIVDDVWVNLDNLNAQLEEGCAARKLLDSEKNYVDFVVLSGQLPFANESFDHILASHFFEHFNTQDALSIMKDCYRLLKFKGSLIVSVPDASYFKKVYEQDRNENWPRLFGVTDPNNPIPTFMEAALFFDQHMQLFTHDSLWCTLKQAGYAVSCTVPEVVKAALNRLEFSLILTGSKE